MEQAGPYSGLAFVPQSTLTRTSDTCAGRGRRANNCAPFPQETSGASSGQQRLSIWCRSLPGMTRGQRNSLRGRSAWSARGRLAQHLLSWPRLRTVPNDQRVVPVLHLAPTCEEPAGSQLKPGWAILREALARCASMRDDIRFQIDLFRHATAACGKHLGSLPLFSTLIGIGNANLFVPGGASGIRYSHSWCWKHIPGDKSRCKQRWHRLHGFPGTSGTGVAREWVHNTVLYAKLSTGWNF